MALRDLKTRGEDYERRREKDFFACRVLRERKAQMGRKGRMGRTSSPVQVNVFPFLKSIKGLAWVSFVLVRSKF